MHTILHGDSIEQMGTMPPESVDSIVTDPPYGLGFMGKAWDDLPPSQEWAEACYRVLKPGGHIAAFGGTRTWHRLAVAIEDAGFEMRDSLAWLYGSGFPKSHDVGKAIDRMAGAEREVIGSKVGQPGYHLSGKGDAGPAYGANLQQLTTEQRQAAATITAPATPEAAEWSGWGTALKPAFEPIVLARKPLAEKTVAKNVLEHGTGAINIDACRIEGDMSGGTWGCKQTSSIGFHGGTEGSGYRTSRNPAGRWPANVILDEHAAAWVDEQSGQVGGQGGPHKGTAASQGVTGWKGGEWNWKDTGGASRFFYTAKAPKRERPNVNGVQHPTVKPLAIMQWLIRLVTPPNGAVLDPFAGSGTTIEAAITEGFNAIGIEREAEYLPLIQHRIDRTGILAHENESETTH